MKRVVIIGGGFAGLSAAVYLSEKNNNVILLEASPKLGGRAYSLFNKDHDEFYDNGQYIMMGCYDETLSFLQKINSLDKVSIQDSLSINFVKRGGEVLKLDSPKKFYPFNLLSGLLNYKALTLKERFKIIDFILDVICFQSCDLKDKTVADWLKCEKQNSNSIKSFWEILVVGALNTTIDKASAEIFHTILSKIFFGDSKSSSIVIPNVGLSQLYTDSAAQFVNEHGGKIILSERVKQINLKGDTAEEVITDKSTYNNFDFLISAIPAYAFENIICDNSKALTSLDIPVLNYSPILNVHLWLKENPFKENFYGLIDSKIHWLFNNKRHVSLTTSSAEWSTGLDNSTLLKEFYFELENYFPIFQSSLVIDHKIIKEKRATFIPNIESNQARMNFSSKIDNMIYAGDWVNTGLPSTIESAVLSGRLAAEKVVTSSN
jgi:hydroxysqualene dehydroxylase